MASRFLSLKFKITFRLHFKLTVQHILYGGKLCRGKIWRIHCINTLGEENLANCEVLQVKISRKTYSVKHSERLYICHAINLWRKISCDAMLSSSFTHLKPLSRSQNQIWCWSSASWSFVRHLFNLSICRFNCLGWHKIIIIIII